MKKFLVVTSITNGKDKLIDPSIVFDNCDYLAFVDKKEKTSVWTQKDVMDYSSIDNYKHRRNAKPYKILSTILFSEYEYIIWEDGNHQLNKNPQSIIDEYGEGLLYLFKHPDRDCAYDELNACLNWKMDNTKSLQDQLNYYESVRFPKKFGLFEMSTFMVKNNEQIKKLQLSWFEQINRFSSRDQISFPFCLWKHKLLGDVKILKGYANLYSMKGNNGGNEYFQDQGRHLKY